MTPPKFFRFLALPAEIRLMIYSLLLLFPEEWIVIGHKYIKEHKVSVSTYQNILFIFLSHSSADEGFPFSSE